MFSWGWFYKNHFSLASSIKIIQITFVSVICDFSFTGSGKPDALMRGRTIPVVCKRCKSIYDRIIEPWTDEPLLGCKTYEAKDYTEWDYEKKSCPKCVDGVIGKEEGGTITMTD